MFPFDDVEYFFESLCATIDLNKYWPAIRFNMSPTYLTLILSSVAAVILTILFGPTGECDVNKSGKMASLDIPEEEEEIDGHLQANESEKPCPSPPSPRIFSGKQKDVEENAARRKLALLQEMEKKLTREELEDERKTQEDQLANIYSLLSENRDKFGKFSRSQVDEQMSMYNPL